ncbi:hypothetical protein AAMO2058_000043600 [Amorphochlora amoebiformis]
MFSASRKICRFGSIFQALIFSSALLGLLYVLQGHVDRPDLGNDLVVVFGEGEVAFFGDSVHGHEERKKAEKGAKKALEERHSWRFYSGMCDSFPHLRQNITQESYEVMVSVLVFEELWYLKFYFDIMLHYTTQDTVILAHLSSTSNYTEDGIRDLVNHHPRLLINCHRYYTRRYHGSLGHAQLQNILWAQDIGLKYKIFVMFSSNSFLIRPGMEDYVLKHTATEKAYESSFLHRLKMNQIRKHPVGGWAPQAVYSRVYAWEPFRKVILAKLGNNISADTVVLVHGKHEGAFFPYSVGIGLATALKNEKDALLSMLEQETYLEEFIFHTWAGLHKDQFQNASGHSLVSFGPNRVGNHDTVRIDYAIRLGFYGVKMTLRDKDDKQQQQSRNFIYERMENGGDKCGTLDDPANERDNGGESGCPVGMGGFDSQARGGKDVCRRTFRSLHVVTNGAEKTLIITELPSHILEPKSLSESKPISNSSESKSGFSESKSGFSEPRGITEPRSKSSEARIKGPLGMCEAVRAYGGRGRGIVVSVAAFEKLWYIEDMIRNLLILSENTTVILLHLNKNSPYSQNQLESENNDTDNLTPDSHYLRKQLEGENTRLITLLLNSNSHLSEN